MNIQDYGFYGQVTPENNIGIPARVTAVHRDSFAIVCDQGSGLAQVKRGEYYKGSEDFPTTGDFVLLDWQEHNASRIIKTLPRKTYFARLDPSSSGQNEQAVAANFDYVFIIQSLERDFNLRRLERYLTLAWQSGATPVVILTKADCVEDYYVHVRAAEQLAIGVDVLAVSANTGLGLEQLDKYLQPRKTLVFLGSSGVGKSTLLNKLAGRDIMNTGKVRDNDGRGRHTTSHRQLILLDSGVMIIDTPGMRELGMWDVSEGLEQSFADVEQYLGQCKFSDCRHQSEPGCAVRNAISRGQLAQERWESYLRLNAEARFSSDKAGYLREKQQWHKEISKKIKAMQTPSYQHTTTRHG